jgi:ATP-binding cassette, subfamily B, bacterial MsbA
LGVQVPLFALKWSNVHRTKFKKLSASQEIARSLRPWRFRVYCANFAAIILGLVSAILGVVIGPAMLVLLDPSVQSLRMDSLLGPIFASMTHNWFAGDAIATADLYRALPVVLICVATVKSLLTFWQWYTWESLGEKIAFGWRRALVDSFIFVNPALRDDGRVAQAEGELGGLLAQDIRTCRDFVVHYYGGLPREGLQVLFMSISLAALSPKLFVIFLFCVAPVVALLNTLGKKLRRRATESLEENSHLGEWIQQRLLGLETIKQYCTEELEISAMRVGSHRLFSGFFRSARVKARTSPLIECLGVMAMSLALSVAFSDIALGKISGSVAMSFFSSLALLAQAASKLGRYFNSNREGIAAANRIFRAIDELDAAAQSQVCPEGAMPAARSSIRLKGVTVRYGDKIAVENFNFEFQMGKVYCLVGASGAGKSSVFNAVLGVRPVASGTIEYFYGPGVEKNTLPIVYMPQQVPVIPGKLAENVSYPNIVYNQERVATSLAAVGFSIEKSRMPLGLETLVGPGNLQLSGGQLQRLQIARLAYHQAPFVLVDEGTSALDPELEQVVLAHIRDIARAGAVVIMIAHRKSAVDISDELLVMESGRLAIAGVSKSVVNSEPFMRSFGGVK